MNKPLNRGHVSGLATLPAPPPSIPLWGKVLWYLAESAAGGVIWNKFASGQEMAPTQTDATAPDADVWARFVLEWANVTTLDTADTQVNTFDVLNFTNGAIDSSWTQADMTAVADRLQTFATSIAAVTSSSYECTRIAGYLRAFNAYSNPKPFAESGSPVFTRTVALVGAGTNTTPMQVRSTITEETPSRSHWGRVYLPTPGNAFLEEGGNLTVSYVDSTVSSYLALVNGLLSSDFQLVVPTTQSDKVPTRTLQHLTGIRADTTPDIIRRGRRHVTAYHNIQPPLTAATKPADDTSLPAG